MVSMGKPYSRYRSFNDAVSLTIFIAIDIAQFVKFITEVQDKNSKLMPLAEMMILRNIMDNRKEQLSELSRKVQKSLDETKKSCNELFHTKIGVKLCSMAGGGVSRNLWHFFRPAPAGTGQAVTCSTSGMGLRLK